MIINVRTRMESLIRGNILNSKKDENFNNRKSSEEIDLDKRSKLIAEEEIKEYKIR